MTFLAWLIVLGVLEYLSVQIQFHLMSGTRPQTLFLLLVHMNLSVNFPLPMRFMTFQVVKPLTYIISIFAGSAAGW